jgi:hypothetical protein
MPRSGPAWFLTFGRTDARSIFIIEVDDATEQVTRVRCRDGNGASRRFH